MPGIYLILGDLYARKEDEESITMARACYSMCIFFGDDGIQHECMQHIQRSVPENNVIMGIKSALDVLDKHEIQFGYSDLSGTIANVITRRFPEAADLDIKNVMMNPGDIVQ